jgi:hypothetical protein
MTVTKEYWNIPKADDVLSVAQGTNLTVFVDHADDSLLWGLSTSDVISLVLSAIGIVIGYFAYRAASKASDAAETANRLARSEADSNKTHNMLSVRPAINLYKDIIRVAEGRDGKPCLRLVFQLKNCGLGPAQYTNINLKIGGELVLDSIKGIRPDLYEYFIRF